MLPAAHMHAEANAADNFRMLSSMTTYFVGAQVPVEMVTPQQQSRGGPSAVRGRDVKSRPVTEGASLAATQPLPLQTTQPAMSGGRNVQLTPELRVALKDRLSSLLTGGNQDFQSHPRAVKYFVKELQETCELLEAPQMDRSHRDACGCHCCHHFAALLPQLKDAVDLPPVTAKLPKTGWLGLTLLLALLKIPWDFTYNSMRHRVCNCRSLFPNLDGCVTPLIGEAQMPPPPTSQSKTATNDKKKEQYTRVLMTRRRERHFPPRMADLARNLRTRTLEFTAKLHAFVEDFASIPEKALAANSPQVKQHWERFLGQFLAEVSVLDSAYTQFEIVLLAAVEKMIRGALAPVEKMCSLSGALLGDMRDPFREMQRSIFCQQLGLLKRQVSFGGPFNLVYFDAGLLVKAQRVVQMDTYKEVRELASTLLTKFDALCKVLSELRIEQVQPEAAKNPELKTAVLELDGVWAQCQFLLRQETLDFVGQLLDFLRRNNLGQQRLEHLQIAMLSKEEASSIDDEELRQARTTLFRTLPMLVYVDEVQKDVISEKDGEEVPYLFRDLFCPKDERHAMLRSEFAKFEKQSWPKFRSLVFEDAIPTSQQGRPRPTSISGAREKLLRDMLANVRELASFPVEDPEAVLRKATEAEETFCDGVPLGDAEVKALRARRHDEEAHARWVCVQRLVQMVEKKLFSEVHSRGFGGDRPETGLSRRTKASAGAPVGQPLSTPGPNSAVDGNPSVVSPRKSLRTSQAAVTAFMTQGSATPRSSRSLSRSGYASMMRGNG